MGVGDVNTMETGARLLHQLCSEDDELGFEQLKDKYPFVDGYLKL
jgi:hypothetical protein